MIGRSRVMDGNTQLQKESASRRNGLRGTLLKNLSSMQVQKQ